MTWGKDVSIDDAEENMYTCNCMQTINPGIKLRIVLIY